MLGFKHGIGVLAALCLAASAPALAQAPKPAAPAGPGFAIDGLTVQEIADQTEVSAAMADFGKSGYAALERHVAALQGVVSHAPASYPKTEIRGEVALVRADPPELGPLTLTALLAAPGKNLRAVQSPNIYPMACLMLASHANENLRHPEALRFAEQGLAMQPDSLQLIPEKGFALNKLRRPVDALAAYDGGLKSGVPMSSHTKAVLMRGKGFALVELQRLDEAKAIYEDSLKLEPGNPTALGELQFIANARKPKPTT